jgi:type VI secretion system protein ImpE
MADQRVHELYQQGDLQGALSAQTELVRSHPGDVALRSYLFGLLCIAGRLEQAERQLDALGAVDPQVETGARVYRLLLQSEAHRRAVFAGETRPMLPPEAPPEARLRLEALQASLAGDAATAAARLEAAADASPLLAGKLNGDAFDALRDADDLLASIVELYAGGRYVWLPLARVRSVRALERRSIVDLLWRPVTLLDADGVEASVHLPMLYPSLGAPADDRLALGRATEWRDDPALGQRGAGQHVLLAYRGDEERELPLLDLEMLELWEA